MSAFKIKQAKLQERLLKAQAYVEGQYYNISKKMSVQGIGFFWLRIEIIGELL